MPDLTQDRYVLLRTFLKDAARLINPVQIDVILGTPPDDDRARSAWYTTGMLIVIARESIALARQALAELEKSNG